VQLAHACSVGRVPVRRHRTQPTSMLEVVSLGWVPTKNLAEVAEVPQERMKMARSRNEPPPGLSLGFWSCSTVRLLHLGSVLAPDVCVLVGNRKVIRLADNDAFAVLQVAATYTE